MLIIPQIRALFKERGMKYTSIMELKEKLISIVLFHEY